MLFTLRQECFTQDLGRKKMCFNPGPGRDSSVVWFETVLTLVRGLFQK